MVHRAPRAAGRREPTPGRARRRLALLACALGFAVVQLDVSVVDVAIKPIGAKRLLGYAIVLISAALLLIVERHSPAPLLPLAYVRSRTLAATTAMGFVVHLAFDGLIFVLSLYFQTAHHFRALVTGLAFAPTTCAVFAGNLLAGRLIRSAGTLNTARQAGSVVGVAMFGALSARDLGSGLRLTVAATIGLALGLVILARMVPDDG